MLLNRRLAPIALIALVCGCNDVAAPRPDIAVRATIDRTQFRVGDEVTIRAEVRNEGAAAARVPVPSTMLEVRDASNRVVFFGRSGTFAAIGYPPRIVGPGDVVTESPMWATHVVGLTGGDAPAGTYRVRVAVLLLRRSDYVIDAASVRYVFSEPIEVSVVDR